MLLCGVLVFLYYSTLPLYHYHHQQQQNFLGVVHKFFTAKTRQNGTRAPPTPPTPLLLITHFAAAGVALKPKSQKLNFPLSTDATEWPTSGTTAFTAFTAATAAGYLVLTVLLLQHSTTNTTQNVQRKLNSPTTGRIR